MAVDIADALAQEFGMSTTKNAVISKMHRHKVQQFASVPEAMIARQRADDRLARYHPDTLAARKATAERKAARDAARAQAEDVVPAAKLVLPPVPRESLQRAAEAIPSTPRAPRPPSLAQFGYEPGPPGGIPFVETREGQCRFIEGEADAHARCCGARTIPGRSWCPRHAAIVWQSTR